MSLSSKFKEAKTRDPILTISIPSEEKPEFVLTVNRPSSVEISKIHAKGLKEADSSSEIANLSNYIIPLVLCLKSHVVSFVHNPEEGDEVIEFNKENLNTLFDIILESDIYSLTVGLAFKAKLTEVKKK
jgi:hypothetical protein